MSAALWAGAPSDADILERLHNRLLDDARAGEFADYSDFDLSGGRPEVVALTEAAVLVGLVTRPEGLSLVLTQRTADMPTHAGQIALPGGRRQAEDDSLAATALREASEEVGIDPALVRVLGVGDSYQTVTRFRVTPVVALVDPAASLRADPREVAEVFEVPFAFFMNPENHQRHTRQWNGMDRHYYAMPWGERYVWGATAGMLRALWLRLFSDPRP